MESGKPDSANQASPDYEQVNQITIVAFLHQNSYFEKCTSDYQRFNFEI
jgi:hypothetical protein